MKVTLPDIPPEQRSPAVETLLELVRQLLDRVDQLDVTNQQLRDQIASLKGQKPRPQISPSSLHLPAPTATPTPKERRRGKPTRPRTSELTLHREVALHPPPLPEGATLKGQEPQLVQDLLIPSDNTRYLRARYQLPEGGSLLAPLPAGVLPLAGGHFGANGVADILDQQHPAQVTEPLLLEPLGQYGLDLSAGQLHALLTDNQACFHQDKAEGLAVGLVASSSVGTDDTAARPQGQNGYCTALGNDRFASVESSDCKSRLHFLPVLQGVERDEAINETTLAYWERQKLAAAVRASLTQGPQEFAGAEAWTARLAALAITEERHVRLATAGALLGGLIAHGVSPDLVVLSEAAPQFVLLMHAACWIHAERPLAKLVPPNEEHRAALEQVRSQSWGLYQDLKAYREQPREAQRRLWRQRFDALVEQRTGYPSSNGVLQEMRDQRADLLRVLERPAVPLPNKAVASDSREYVKRRKISGGTRSEAGRRCRDPFASLKKTCRKLGVRFWEQLPDRVRGLGRLPPLAALIREKAPAAKAKEAVAMAA